MQIILKSLVAGLALMPAGAFAGGRSQSDIDAAIASVGYQDYQTCAASFGGEFSQSVEQRDLNHDGVNELIVYTTTVGASGCIGWVGQQIDLLIADGDGGWQRNLGFDTHSLNYFSRDDSDWPDIELTGPGFCFPIWRYHEGAYGIWKTCEDGRLVYAEGLRSGAVPASTSVHLIANTQGAAPRFRTVPGKPSRSVVPSVPVEIMVNPEQVEGGAPYLHNGSIMWVFPEHGLIIYAEPRKGLSVQPGTVLFKGRPWEAGNEDAVIRGTALVFRKGCEAAPYEVRGMYHHMYQFAQFTLEGVAPVRRKGSCDIAGHDIRSDNGTLKFDAAWD